MKILALDTSTKFLCLGFYDGIRTYEYNLEVGKSLSSLLAQTLQRSLDALGWRVFDIDYFACGKGPGSFTGMRTGMAAIKAMSWAAKKPVVGISSLDILAQDALNCGKLVMPIIDAKRSLFYCSIFKRNRSSLDRIRPYMLIGLEEALKQAKPDIFVLGDGIELCKEKLLSNIKGVHILDKGYWYPKAHNIIELALDLIKKGRLDTTFSIKPMYLYPKECQVKLKEKKSA